MSATLFDAVLTTSDMSDVFSDTALVQAMLRFEQALARAQAEEGLIPADAACVIASHCRAEKYHLAAIVADGRVAGSVAIPLVKALTLAVRAVDSTAAGFVHWGSTSQDVIDTALVLATREALALLDRDLQDLLASLLTLAEQHAATPMLARTLLQPAQVMSFGLKVAGWAAPLTRARERLRTQAARALALQLGGAVGTLAAMGERAPQIAQRMAAELELTPPAAPWHTQRDEWVRLGLEVSVLVGGLSKIATDLTLMCQAEVGELAEPMASGRGGSSAMPHKKNPVAAMSALAAAQRTPHYAAALLAAMGQQHERGLGNWQAEVAEWPNLFLSAHGALHALAGAMRGLHVDAERMRSNIDAQRGLVFSEAATMLLAAGIGRDRAHALMEELTLQAAASQPLEAVLRARLASDSALRDSVDAGQLQRCFDVDAAAAHCAHLARQRLAHLREALHREPP